MQFSRKSGVTGMLLHPGFRCVSPFAGIDQSLQEPQFIHFLAIHNLITEFRAVAQITNLAGGFHGDEFRPY